MMILKKKKVLFMCTGNSARSQMAEGLLRWHGGRYFEVYSAGLEPKGINPYTIRVMQEIGYEMTSHRSKNLSEYLGKQHFSYLITVCNQADEKCPVFPGMGQRMHWGFEDPAAFVGTDEEILTKFREIRNQIDNAILAWMSLQGLQAFS